jgi:SAM-dependent methyltransferase
MVPLLERSVIPLLPPAATSRAKALDVGCGGQPFRSRIEGLGYAYVGLDIAQNEDETVDVIARIDEPLPDPVAKERFELIICLEVLEHVADWEATFANLAGLLQPGGRLVVTCPHFYELHEEPHDYWRPTLHALEHYARRAGLTAVELTKGGSAWDLFGTALASVRPVPTDRTLVARAMARVFERARRGAFRALRAGWVQRKVQLTGPLYIANVCVFERNAD